MQKKIPLRKCIGCNEMKSKKELIRIVKAPDIKKENNEVVTSGEISLDLTGKKNGRGAYICNDINCFQKAVKAKRLERTFKTNIPQEVYDNIAEELENCE